MVIVVHLSGSELVIDMNRFLFGDGEWVPTINGEDLFS